MNYNDTLVYNDMYNKVENIVKIINNNRVCGICGGSISFGTCMHCGTIYNDVINSISLLESYVFKIEQNSTSFIEDDLHKLFNLLTIIYDLKIESVKRILNKYNYINVFNNKYNIIIDKIKNKKNLNYDDLNLLGCKIISSNLDFDILTIFNYCISNCILGEKNISYDAFKELLRKSTLKIMGTIADNPKCFIVNNNNADGEHIFNKIYLTEEYIQKLYYNGNLQIIHIMFHELKHLIQYKEISDGFISNNILSQIMEMIIREHNNNYYVQNYANISFEKDADYYAIIMFTNYINSLGFVLKNDTLLQQKEDLIQRMDNQDRIVDGKLTTLQDEFNKIIIDKPIELEKYPQLKILYKNIDNKIIKKTDEEIKDYLEQLINSNSLLPQQKKSYYQFYKTYVEKNRSL